eukprot:4265206-Prymnesium_polylepis.1
MPIAHRWLLAGAFYPWQCGDAKMGRRHACTSLAGLQREYAAARVHRGGRGTGTRGWRRARNHQTFT